MSEKPLGDALDRMGIVLDLDEGDLLESAVVIAKVITADGQVAVTLSRLPSQDWLDQFALVKAASRIIDDTGWCDLDEKPS
jgi:hypothetical protein